MSHPNEIIKVSTNCILILIAARLRNSIPNKRSLYNTVKKKGQSNFFLSGNRAAIAVNNKRGILLLNALLGCMYSYRTFGL